MGFFHEATDAQREAKIRQWREGKGRPGTTLYEHLECSLAELTTFWPHLDPETPDRLVPAVPAPAAPALAPVTITTHATGAVRSSDADVVRYDLVSPIALERWAKTCHEGAEKYGDHNWEKGFPVNDLLNHAIRHLYLYLSGDRSEDHLGHALWNVGGAIHSEELWPHLNEGKLRSAGCQPPGTGEEAGG